METACRYFFQKAKQQLENVFGYRVVAVDESATKELYIVLNAQSSQEHLLRLNKNSKSPTRGLLMMVLGLLWCAQGRRLTEGSFVHQSEGRRPVSHSDMIGNGPHVTDWMMVAIVYEDDLWKQLALLDPAIKPTRDHPTLGDVATLLKTFETQLCVLCCAVVASVCLLGWR